MTREEIRQIVWQEINRSLHIVLTGISASADGANEDIQSMLAGLPTIPTCPVAFPYGLAAKTPDGVSQLILQGGNSVHNRFVAGHFDAGRPALGGGEVCLYNQYGQQVRLENGKIKLGSASSSEPLLLGKTFQTLMKTILDAISNHTHPVTVTGVSAGSATVSVTSSKSGTASSFAGAQLGDTILSTETFTS